MSSSENPYAPPLTAPIVYDAEIVADTALWRQGNVLVMRKGSQLPARCVKSNQPTDRRLKRNLYWHHPAIYLTILFGRLSLAEGRPSQLPGRSAPVAVSAVATVSARRDSVRFHAPARRCPAFGPADRVCGTARQLGLPVRDLRFLAGCPRRHSRPVPGTRAEGARGTCATRCSGWAVLATWRSNVARESIRIVC